MSEQVRSRLEEEGLTVTHKTELIHGQPISYDLIES